MERYNTTISYFFNGTCWYGRARSFDLLVNHRNSFRLVNRGPEACSLSMPTQKEECRATVVMVCTCLGSDLLKVRPFSIPASRGRSAAQLYSSTVVALDQQ